MKALLWIRREEVKPMAQLLDRPFIQHVVEQLVKRGITKIVIRVRPQDGDLERLLGDGTRWGIEISCVPGGNDASGPICMETQDEEQELVLFGDASCLAALPDLSAEAAEPSIYFHDENRITTWSGWALLRASDVSSFASIIAAGSDWRQATRSLGINLRKTFLEVPSLGASTAKQIVQSNMRALDGSFPGLFFDGVKQGAGVMVARGVRLASTTVLEGPCYIGQDSWIGEHCRLGPYAVVGRDCVVERGTEISRSVVTEGTCVGSGLRVADSLIVDNTVHNIRLNTAIEIEEEHLVSRLTEGPPFPRAFAKLVSVAFVMTSLILFWIFSR